MKTILYLIIPALGFFLLSLTTNEPDTKTKKYWYKNLRENYAFVPFEKGDFVMLATEVDNFDYQLFLEELKSSGDLEMYNRAAVDTLGWRSKLSYGEPYCTYYHNHPAYRHYPVVNVTREGAELFCEWLTTKLKEADGGQSGLTFRLPTHEEWLFAARGGEVSRTYSWGGPYLRNSKGCYLCNFAALGAENIARDTAGNLIVMKNVDRDWHDHADVTAPTKSYFPNTFGLYNMNGNVAEMVADEEIVAGGSWKDPGYDVRNVSTQPYTGAAPTIGFRVVATVDAKAKELLKLSEK